MLHAKLVLGAVALALPAIIPIPCPAFVPWSATGHGVVAFVAWSQMSEHARDDAHFDEVADAVAQTESASSLENATLAAVYVAAATGIAKRYAVEAGFRLGALSELYFGAQ